MRLWLGIAFLAAQVLWMGTVHVTRAEARYFSWAPNDYMVTYQLRVTTRGRDLSYAEVLSRYRIRREGLFEYPAQHVKDIVSQYERTYGRADSARVVYTYRVNGGPEQVWTWP